MFKFLVKKTFFDMWDNILTMIILNLGYIIVLISGLFIEYAILYGLHFFIEETQPLIGIALGHFIYLPVVFLFFVYSGAVSCLTKDLASGQKVSFKLFVQYLKETYKPSLIFGLLNFVLLFILLVAGIYYLGTMDNLINPTIFFFLVWLFLFWLAASQYFFALQSMFDKKLRKNLRKMLLLLLDNTAFTLFALLLGSLIILGLAVLTLFVLFGFATIFLWYNVALKLRLYKYEYLEEHPEAKRSKIPWDTLLAEEKKIVGRRTFRSLLFPDKD
jgi:uncharacterized membrane protein YesL